MSANVILRHKYKSPFVTKVDLKNFATKDDLKNFATKDDLKNFATKDDLKNFATKDDLKNFATKEDLKSFATKNDLKNFATKIDLKDGLKKAKSEMAIWIVGVGISTILAVTGIVLHMTSSMDGRLTQDIRELRIDQKALRLEMKQDIQKLDQKLEQAVKLLLEKMSEKS